MLGAVCVRVALDEGGLVGEEGDLRREFLILRLMDITSSVKLATISSTMVLILSDRVWGKETWRAALRDAGGWQGEAEEETCG